MTRAPSSGSPTYIPIMPMRHLAPSGTSGTNGSGGAVMIAHAVESSSGAPST